MSPADRRRRRGRAMLMVALLALLGAVLASFAVGPLRLPPLEVMQALAVKLGLLDPEAVSSRDLAVVWQLRIPRALLGAMVGASLAMAGASLQGLFGNPLADPGIVGVSQGAALGRWPPSCSALPVRPAGWCRWRRSPAVRWRSASPTHWPGPARFGQRDAVAGRHRDGCILLGADRFPYIHRSELQSLVFWQMGSLARASWADVAAVVPLFAIGVFALQRLATPLDMLALGERQAQHRAGCHPHATSAGGVQCAAGGRSGGVCRLDQFRWPGGAARRAPAGRPGIAGCCRCPACWVRC